MKTSSQKLTISQKKENVTRVGVTDKMLLFVLLLNLVFLAYRIFITSKITFNSDGATNSLFAGEILSGLNPFPDGWQYNNKDIFLYNHVMFLVPLLKVMPNGYLAYALSTFLFSLFFLLISYQYIKVITRSKKLPLYAVIVLSTGVSSPFISDLLFDWGGSYGSNVLISLIIWGSIVKIYLLASNEEFKIRYIFFNMAILITAVSIASISNPVRASLYYVYPFVFGLLIHFLLSFNDEHFKNKKLLYSLLTTFLLIYLAYTVGRIINGHVTHSDSILTVPIIKNVESLPDHIIMILKSWLFLFGFPTGSAFNLLSEKININSAMGVYLSVKIAFSIISLLIPVVFYKALYRLYKSGSSNFFILLFPGAAFLLAAFIHIFTFTYPPGDYTSIRYIFTPLLLMCIAYLVIFNSVIIKYMSKSWCVAFFLFCVSVIGFMNHVYPSLVIKGHHVEVKKNVNTALLDCLKKNNQRYGYAGFWKSNIITILSESNIKVRPVSITGNSIDMFPVHVLKDWYSIKSVGDNSFILFSKEEYDQINKSWLHKTIGVPSRIEVCGDNTLAIFSYDIKQNLFGNKNLFANKQFYQIEISNESSRQVGIFDPINNSITAEVGKPGLVLYGQYLGVASGEYKIEARFDRLSNCKVTSCGYIDVVSKSGTNLLAKQNLIFAENEKSITLKFRTSEIIKDLEARVYSSGVNGFSVLSPIKIEKLP